MSIDGVQDKQKEIAFFDAHAAGDEYDVFTPEASARLISAFVRLSGLPRGARIADLGCGSGVFTELLRRAGYAGTGLDISPKLVALGRSKYSGLELIEGDAENLPFGNESLEGVLLSGLVHHFPDPRRLAVEVRRVLKAGGRFVAFDPNRMNPFMWRHSTVRSVSPRTSGRSWRRGSPQSSATRVSGCRPTISPGSPIATSPRRRHGRCCRSIISSMPPFSGLRSCGRSAPSC
jgi:SAM-dependent methyltransferase